MKLVVLTLVLSLLLVASAGAVQTKTYDWEDGIGTIMGSYGNLTDPLNVTGSQSGSQGSVVGAYTCSGAYSGDRYLHVAEDPHYSTPQAYIAYIEDLVSGDAVTASFYAYDITAGSAYPSLRLWAHYALNDDVTSYTGSAIPSTPAPAYSTGIGWEKLEWTINFGTDGSPAGAEALVIELRLYSTPTTSDPDHTDYWIDYVSITAPDYAKITFPYNAPTPVDSGTWGRIKGLFR